MTPGHTYISGDRLSSLVLTLLQEAKTELVLASYVISDFKVSWQDGTILDILKQKLDNGIHISLLLGTRPPDYVKKRFCDFSKAIIKICPRAHLKAILVDRKKGLISTGNLTSRGTTIASSKKQNFEIAVSIGKKTTETIAKLVKNILHGTYCTKNTCLRYEKGNCKGIKEVKIS